MDHKIDNLSQGKCCNNIIYIHFARKSKKPYKQLTSVNHSIIAILKANYCLEILVPNEARWRLCSDKAKYISKLQLQIQYNILLSTTGSKDLKLISIFLIKQRNY